MGTFFYMRVGLRVDTIRAHPDPLPSLASTVIVARLINLSFKHLDLTTLFHKTLLFSRYYFHKDNTLPDTQFAYRCLLSLKTHEDARQSPSTLIILINHVTTKF